MNEVTKEKLKNLTIAVFTALFCIIMLIALIVLIVDLDRGSTFLDAFLPIVIIYSGMTFVLYKLLG